MRTEKVLVLLASYNGDKFIEEQLNSILNQNGVTADVMIFDDNSSDNTISIINKELLNFPNRITLLQNVEQIHSPLHSFSYLIKYVKENQVNLDYDFFAFSDQDDIWLPNKIKNGIDAIRKTNSKISISSGIATNLIDKANITIYDRRVYSFGEALLKSNAIGMTMVFTANFFKNVKFPESINLKIWLHDHILYLIALYQGESVVFVNEAGVIYRQHSNNVIGCSKNNLVNRLKNKSRYVLSSQNDRKEIATFLRNNYVGTRENEELLDEYIDYQTRNVFARMNIVQTNKIFAKKNTVYLFTKLLAVFKKL